MNYKNLDITKILENAVLNHKKQKLLIAEDLYKEVIELDPKNVVALNNLGTIYLFSRKFEKATEFFKKAIEIKSDYLDAKKNLQIVNQKIEEKNNIVELWKECISISPEKVSFVLDEFKKKNFFFDNSLNQVKEGNNQLPLLTWPLLDFLKTIDVSHAELCELGSGNSTLWLSKFFKKIKSYETNKEWYESLKDKLRYNVSYNLVSLDQIYQCQIKFKNENWLLIDFAGKRTKFINKLIEYSDNMLPGQIILDNSEWYRNGAKLLGKRGYHEIPFYGFKSGENEISCSSLFLLKNSFKLKILSEFFYPLNSKKINNNWDTLD